MQIGRGDERDGDGRHGRMHAGSAAHHGCDGLGPVHIERMNGESEQIAYTDEITDRERKRKR